MKKDTTSCGTDTTVITKIIPTSIGIMNEAGFVPDDSDDADKLAHGRYRLTATSGHFVILFAQSINHAKSRWEEFYPKVKCDNCQLQGGNRGIQDFLL